MMDLVSSIAAGKGQVVNHVKGGRQGSTVAKALSGFNELSETTVKELTYPDAKDKIKSMLLPSTDGDGSGMFLATKPTKKIKHSSFSGETDIPDDEELPTEKYVEVVIEVLAGTLNREKAWSSKPELERWECVLAIIRHNLMDAYGGNIIRPLHSSILDAMNNSAPWAKRILGQIVEMVRSQRTSLMIKCIIEGLYENTVRHEEYDGSIQMTIERVLFEKRKELPSEASPTEVCRHLEKCFGATLSRMPTQDAKRVRDSRAFAQAIFGPNKNQIYDTAALRELAEAIEYESREKMTKNENAIDAADRVLADSCTVDKDIRVFDISKKMAAEVQHLLLNFNASETFLHEHLDIFGGRFTPKRSAASTARHSTNISAVGSEATGLSPNEFFSKIVLSKRNFKKVLNGETPEKPANAGLITFKRSCADEYKGQESLFFNEWEKMRPTGAKSPKRSRHHDKSSSQDGQGERQNGRSKKAPSQNRAKRNSSNDEADSSEEPKSLRARLEEAETKLQAAEDSKKEFQALHLAEMQKNAEAREREKVYTQTLQSWHGRRSQSRPSPTKSSTQDDSDDVKSIEYIGLPEQTKLRPEHVNDNVQHARKCGGVFCLGCSRFFPTEGKDSLEIVSDSDGERFTHCDMGTVPSDFVPNVDPLIRNVIVSSLIDQRAMFLPLSGSDDDVDDLPSLEIFPERLGDTSDDKEDTMSLLDGKAEQTDEKFADSVDTNATNETPCPQASEDMVDENDNDAPDENGSTVIYFGEIKCSFTP